MPRIRKRHSIFTVVAKTIVFTYQSLLVLGFYLIYEHMYNMLQILHMQIKNPFFCHKKRSYLKCVECFFVSLL